MLEIGTVGEVFEAYVTLNTPNKIRVYYTSSLKRRPKPGDSIVYILNHKSNYGLLIQYNKGK